MAATRKLSRSLIAGSDAFYDYTCVPCASSGKNTEALYKCNECQVFYCVKCVAGHNKFTVNHNVVGRKSKKFKDGQKETHLYDSSELPKDVCEQHHGEVIKMYCRQHNSVCCTVCIAVHHRHCYGVDYIPKIAKRLLKGSEKDGTTAKLEQVRSDLQRQMSKLQKDQQTLNKQRNKFTTEIRRIKTRIIARVEQLERMSITELETKHKEISGEMNRQSRKVENMLKAVETRLDKLKGNQITTKAQLFVDIKFGNLKTIQGQDCIKQTSEKSFEQIEFKLNTKILSILNETQAFGMLTAYVDVLVPEETEVTRTFLGSLQDELKRCNIKSKCIQPKEVVKGRYTIVVCEKNADLDLKRNIKRICSLTNKVVVLELTNMSILASAHLDSIVDDWINDTICEVYYKTDKNGSRSPTVWFPAGLNRQTFETLSMVLRV